MLILSAKLNNFMKFYQQNLAIHYLNKFLNVSSHICKPFLLY